MQEDGQILYLTREQVNDDMWNACIDSSSNGLIYGYTHYLDAMADNWDALVFENYKKVMPLPWRKKWSIHYLYQPFLTAQLGAFGGDITKEIFQSFLAAVPKKFSYWDFSLNHKNLFTVKSFPLYERSNFVLSLNQPYESIYKNYRDNVKRNIKKSIEYGCTAKKDVAINDIIELTKLQATNVSQNEFDNFKRLFDFLKENGKGKTYGIVSAKGDLIASAAFIFSHNRAYYILVGNHPNGKT